MMIPAWIWVPVAYFSVGLIVTCVLQATETNALPPRDVDGARWDDCHRGMTCLFWPAVIIVWGFFLIFWALSTGLGRVIGAICPGPRRW